MQTLKQLQSGQLKGAVSLTLSEGLTDFPDEIFDLADTLEKLDLSRNNLNTLPAGFGRLKKLKIFFASENPFTVLPEVLGDCPVLDVAGFKSCIIKAISPNALNPNLRWLILTNNRLTELPPAIGKCHRLEKLMLAGNRLKALPAQMQQCLSLALLRISANQLTKLPEWLLTMPKLSWLAFSGNPFSIRPDIEPLPPVNWDELEIQRVLGEGASGLISMAALYSNGRTEAVAVKIFKGDITSDGLPEDEMNICVAAGQHPGLVPLIGEVTNHPNGKKGLVMGLIPKQFFNLGLTPSMDSCTRDIFAPDRALAVSQVIKIARTIASLAAQLHGRGIMHGDMYAHNTMIDPYGNTVFGDFGAASFYDGANTPLALAIERLEISAYGHLLDDLLNLCTAAETNPVLTRLTHLRDACHNPQVSLRPDFADINRELSLL